MKKTTLKQLKLERERKLMIEKTNIIWSPERSYVLETINPNNKLFSKVKVSFLSAGECCVLGIFAFKAEALAMIALDISKLTSEDRKDPRED